MSSVKGPQAFSVVSPGQERVLLSMRLYNCLYNMDVRSLMHSMGVPDARLMAQPGFGKKSLEELYEVTRACGFDRNPNGIPELICGQLKRADLNRVFEIGEIYDNDPLYYLMPFDDLCRERDRLELAASSWSEDERHTKTCQLNWYNAAVRWRRLHPEPPDVI